MVLRSAAVAATSLLFVACSSSTPVLECASDNDCGVGNVCQRGACAVNAAPLAAFPAPGAATTHRVITLSGSATDPEGRAATLRWSVRAVEGGCEPDVGPADALSTDLVFWCPGRYEAAAVAVDDLGLEGPPAVQVLEVTAAVGAPSVTAGLAIAATHRCDATVPACEVLGPGGAPSLSLGAAGTDPGNAALAYEWAAIPPAGVGGDAPLSVTFAPGADAAQPTVTVSNAGGAIAGRYRFRVRVRNPQGLVAQAFQEVTVANSAPVPLPAKLSVPHRFDGARYVAEGDLAIGARDPDGDPLAVTALVPSAPAPGCIEKLAPGVGATASVHVACLDAASLIGATARTLAVTIEDPNGGALAVEAPLLIENQAPVVSLAVGAPLLGDHHVAPCILAAGPSCFVADGPDPFTVHDPDGDPLAEYQLVATVAAARTSSKGIVSPDGETRRFRFETPATLPLEFRSASGASGFSLSASVADPWTTAGAVASLTIANRPPIVKEAVPAVSVPHAYDAAARRYVATASGARFEDPDGDPLRPSAVAFSNCNHVRLDAGRAVIDCWLSWDYTLGGLPPLQDFATVNYSSASASDGWASVAATTLITILDRPATVSVSVTSVESCACTWASPCWKLAYTSKGVRVPVLLADPDGDPSQVSITAHGGASTPAAPVTCLPGWCYPTFDAPDFYTVSGIVSAQASAFARAAEASFSLAPTCSSAGSCCTP
jgi:hypothetical protein